MKEAFGVFGASLMKAPKLVIFTKNPHPYFYLFLTFLLPLIILLLTPPSTNTSTVTTTTSIITVAAVLIEQKLQNRQ